MRLITPNLEAAKTKMAATDVQQRRASLARYTDDQLASISIYRLSKTFNMSKTTLLYRINTAGKTRREAIALPTQYHSPFYSDCI